MLNVDLVPAVDEYFVAVRQRNAWTRDTMQNIYHAYYTGENRSMGFIQLITLGRRILIALIGEWLSIESIDLNNVKSVQKVIYSRESMFYFVGSLVLKRSMSETVVTWSRLIQICRSDGGKIGKF